MSDNKSMSKNPNLISDPNIKNDSSRRRKEISEAQLSSNKNRYNKMEENYAKPPPVKRSKRENTSSLKEASLSQNTSMIQSQNDSVTSSTNNDAKKICNKPALNTASLSSSRHGHTIEDGLYVNRNKGLFSAKRPKNSSDVKLTTDYRLPASSTTDSDPSNSNSSKYTNKIKNKISTTRPDKKQTTTYEAPPTPVNLENVLFPTMRAIPQFNFSLPAKIPDSMVTPKKENDSTSSGQFKFDVLPPRSVSFMADTESTKKEFSFSEPKPRTIASVMPTFNITENKDENQLIFIVPTKSKKNIASRTNMVRNMIPKPSAKLNEGSVLDVLMKFDGRQTFKVDEDENEMAATSTTWRKLNDSLSTLKPAVVQSNVSSSKSRPFDDVPLKDNKLK